MKYVIAAIVLFACFAVLSVLIVKNNSQLLEWDHSAFTKLNNPVGKSVDDVMVDLSKYGREVVWIGVLVILFMLGKKDGRHATVFLTITFLILIPLGTVLKTEIDRQRPIVSDDKLLIKHDTDPSFPSGHAAIVSGGAAVLFLRFNKGKQILFSLALGIEAALVCYSRIYVGNHYPVDVIGGILLGSGIACAVIASRRYVEPIFSRLALTKK